MTTQADMIRALAADGLTRAQIRAQLPAATRQAIDAALRSSGRQGRPRKRCARCTCAVCGGTWEPSRLRKGATT